jgi:hypothetical protein
MSNYLAIATVTATIARILRSEVRAVNGSAPAVTTLQPVQGSGIPDVGVNIFLYQVTPNAAVNNADLNLRRPKGDLIKRFQTGLDLNYLFTFYGDEQRLEAQLLMGSVVQTLSDYPFLTSDMFKKTLNDPMFDYLAESTLIDQTERVRFTPLPLNADEMGRIWNTMPQSNSALAIAYQATIILIEGTDPGEAPVPVRELRTYVGLGQPVLERLIHVGKQQQVPITSRSTLLLMGQNLAGSDTLIRIGNAKTRPKNLTDKQATISLPDVSGLRPGTQSLQVLHCPPIDRRLIPNRMREPDQEVESNALAIVICPSIASVLDVSVKSGFGKWFGAAMFQDESDPRQGEITLELDLAVDPEQRVLLIMNRMIPVDGPATLDSAIFRAKPRDSVTEEITFPFYDLQPGEYLMRVQVDGAESDLQVDEDSQSPTFEQLIGPKVSIS